MLQRNSNESSDDSENIYELERIIDVANYQKEKELFRVRWRGYKPADDTWEPRQNITGQDAKCHLKMFSREYESLRRQEKIPTCKASEDREKGANVLSRWIDRIESQRSCRVNGEDKMYYLVHWAKHPREDATWECEDSLVHAWDKVEKFRQNHRKKPKKKKRKKNNNSQVFGGKICGKTRRPWDEHARWDGEREFWKGIERGKIPRAQLDLHSTDKAARHPKETQKQRKQKKSEKKSCITTVLPRYDRRQQEEALRGELADRRFILQGQQEAFLKAVERNDFPLVFYMLRSELEFEVDYASLFQSAVRRGHRDVALLLATKVSDLNACDSRGDPPLALAASAGDLTLTRYLVGMGALVNPKTQNGDSPLSLASKNGYTHVVKFLNHCTNQARVDD